MKFLFAIIVLALVVVAWRTAPPYTSSVVVNETTHYNGADARKAIKECLEIPDLSTSVTINQQGDPVILYTITCRSHYEQ